MEQKCLKTNVYQNEVLFCDSVEQAIDIDFTLPDYCQDISKIYKCHATPRVSSKGIIGKTITVDISIAINLIYADKEGKLCSFEYPYSISKSVDMAEECVGAFLNCRVKCEYINCRAVTGRKVDVHGAVGINLKVFKRKSTEIVTDFADDTVELKRGVAPATVPMGYAEKYLLIEEELRVPEGMPPAMDIIRSDINCSVKDTKVMGGKTVVKGVATVCIIYSPTGGGVPQSIKTELPFNQIIDVEGITEACSCETRSQVAFFDVKPRQSQSGECKLFSMTAKLLLCCEAYCPNEIEVVLDAFSRKYESDIKHNKVTFDKITENVNELYHFKKSVELQENISSVVDMRCSISSYTASFEENSMQISGSLAAGLILCNEDGDTVYCEKNIDFIYSHPSVSMGGILHTEPKLEIMNCGYTITSATTVEIRADISVNTAIYEKTDINLISEMTVDTDSPITEKRKAALTIYFPSGTEQVFDVARIYKASVEEIMQINGLESQQLKSGDMILVPVV